LEELVKTEEGINKKEELDVDKITTAKVRIKTIERLKSLLGEKTVKKKETVDDCISRLLDFYEQAHAHLEHPMPAEVVG